MPSGALQISIDASKRARDVEQITHSDSFASLKEKAEEARKLSHASDED